MLNITLTILLGALPEALYFAIVVIFAKHITAKRNIFTIMIGYTIVYIISSILLYCNIWFYVLLFASLYGVLRLADKSTEKVDLFLLTTSATLLALFGYLCYGVQLVVGSYAFAYVLNRLCLFWSIVTLAPRLHKWYNVFKNSWNVNPNSKIKSITLRNIIIVVLNVLIILVNIALLAIKRGV